MRSRAEIAARILGCEGSITKLLSSLFDDLRFEVLEQRVCKAGVSARKLGVGEDVDVCFRRSAFVLQSRFSLQSQTVPSRTVCLAFSIFSLTVLESISPGFLREVLRGKSPIGEIIEDFGLNFKRERLWSVTTTDVKTVLNTLPEYKPILIDYNVGGEYLIMNSRIVENGRTVFDVLEVFNLNAFD